MLPRQLALATGTAVATAAVCRQLEQMRRPIPASTPTTMSAALPSLRTSGVSVVNGVLDQELIAAVKSTAAFQSMPSQIIRPTREERQRQREESFRVRRGDTLRREENWRASAPGRLHRREETFDATDIQVLDQVERCFWPLVQAFFQDGNDGEDGDIYRSELQVMTALPGSAAQT